LLARTRRFDDILAASANYPFPTLPKSIFSLNQNWQKQNNKAKKQSNSWDLAMPLIKLKNWNNCPRGKILILKR
jgi:hypothetical protein